MLQNNFKLAFIHKFLIIWHIIKTTTLIFTRYNNLPKNNNFCWCSQVTLMDQNNIYVLVQFYTRKFLLEFDCTLYISCTTQQQSGINCLTTVKKHWFSIGNIFYILKGSGDWGGGGGGPLNSCIIPSLLMDCNKIIPWWNFFCSQSSSGLQCF